MTISYPVTLPSGNRRSVQFRPYSVVSMSTSPFTLQQQAQSHQGQIWVVRVQLALMKRTDAEAWIATLLSLNGRYGTFYLGDPSATSPRGSAATRWASSTVTRANTALSFVAGSSYADLTGVDLAAHAGRLLTLTDSGGKTATGWLKAAGSGVTYGANLLSGGDMPADIGTYWDTVDATIASVAGGQAGNCMELTRTGGTFQQALQGVAGQTAGTCYELTAYLKSGTSGDEEAYLGFYDDGADHLTSGYVLNTFTSSGAWVSCSLTATPRAGQVLAEVFLHKNSATAGTMLFDTVSLRARLTASATGATIVSTEGGTTYTWASEQTGFNRADAAGYTYTITDSDGGLVKGASQTGQTLITDSWLPSATGILLRGDWIQIGSGTTQRIYRVLTDVNADVNGEATLDIWPRLRESPADNAQIVVENTAGVFRLTHNDMSWDVDNALIYGIEFEAAEAL